VRQGRLKLALEEVLTTQPNPSDPPPDPKRLRLCPHSYRPSFCSVILPWTELPVSSRSVNQLTWESELKPGASFSRSSQDQSRRSARAADRWQEGFYSQLWKAVECFQCFWESASGADRFVAQEQRSQQSLIARHMCLSLLYSRGDIAVFKEPRRSDCWHASYTLIQLI